MNKDTTKARADAIAALIAGAPLEKVAKALFDAENTTASEISYVQGVRSAMTRMLGHVLGELGYHDSEATRAKWILEREETVSKLREVCAEFGDNDWEPDLHLGDVVDKHLHRHLDALISE